MSNRDVGIRNLIPGVRSPEEINEDQKTQKYVETVVKQRNHVLEMDPLETFLRATPTINLKTTPKEETKETIDDVLKHQARGAEMVRKARQNPEWVAEHNKRFGSISKTTVLPKDKGPNEKTIQQLKALKEHHYPKSKPMPINTYVDKMNVLYSGQEKRKVDDQGKWINDDKKLKAFVKAEDPTKGAHYIPWQDRMAQEEAESLNNIKRSTWEQGGKVTPEPKYVSAQDVINVYKPKEPEATPLQVKKLHQRLQNHNERTGLFKSTVERPSQKPHFLYSPVKNELEDTNDPNWGDDILNDKK